MNLMRGLVFSGVGRSSIYFENIKKLQSMMDESEIARKVAPMRCLITFIKEDNFADAVHFVDYISGLQGNPILSKMKHLILMTSDLDHSLLKNKTTSNFNVYIISPVETGINAVKLFHFIL